MKKKYTSPKAEEIVLPAIRPLLTGSDTLQFVNEDAKDINEDGDYDNPL